MKGKIRRRIIGCVVGVVIGLITGLIHGNFLIAPKHVCVDNMAWHEDVTEQEKELIDFVMQDADWKITRRLLYSNAHSDYFGADLRSFWGKWYIRHGTIDPYP
jgi:hypothetical protein